MSPMSRQGLARFQILMAVVVVTLVLDQATKLYAMRHLELNAPAQSYLGDILRIGLVLNPGAFLGLGGNLDPQAKFWIMTIPTTLILGWVLVYVQLSKSIDRWSFYALAMIAAGGIGNFIDRVRMNGLVIDFLNLGLGEKVWMRTGIFNIADVAITAGFVMLLPSIFKGDPNPEEAATPPAAS